MGFFIMGLYEFKKLKKLLNKILMTQQELLDAITGVKDQLSKASGEITTKIADLEAAIANSGNTTAAVDAALADLKTAAQGLDDIVPDVAPPTT